MKKYGSGRGILWFLLVFFAAVLFFEKPSTVTIDRSVIGKSTVVMAGYYTWSYRFRFAHGANGAGESETIVKVMSDDEVFSAPNLSFGKNPRVWYDINAVFVPYVVPSVLGDGGNPVYAVYSKTGENFASSDHVGESLELQFQREMIDPKDEDSLKNRIEQLWSIQYWAQETTYTIIDGQVKYLTPGLLTASMKPELKHICRFWKPEYHSKLWRGDRREMPVVCQGVLGVRRYDQL